MEKVFNFLTFTNSNTFYILFGIVILTNSSAIIGTFIFLRNKSLISDLISHSIFPGICLSFMICGEKKILYFIIGAFFTSYISLFLVYIIPKKSKIKEDASIAIILSLFFGIGIFLLTIIQKFDNSNKTGLNNFLFGNAASIIIEDLIIFSLISILVISTITIFFNQLLLISFDSNFSISIGLPTKFIEFIITFIIILSIISGIQVIGIILMSSILITPSVAARFWTENLKIMIILSSFFGIISGLTGAFISYFYIGLPTGPLVILIISFILIFSFCFSPKKGLIFKIFRNYF